MSEFFNLMKVFDCQQMPKEVRSYLFENYGEGKSNDCLISVFVESDEELDEEGNVTWNPVTTWLNDNGASEGEQVIVKFWW